MKDNLDALKRNMDITVKLMDGGVADAIGLATLGALGTTIALQKINGLLTSEEADEAEKYRKSCFEKIPPVKI